MDTGILRVWRRRVGVVALAAAGLTAALSLPTAAPGAARAWALPGAGTGTAVLPVGPDQQFAASVNGAVSDARIAVVCGEGAYRGHPRAGQWLGIAIPEVIMNPAFGDTGDRGRRVVARLATPIAGGPPLAVFTEFTRGPLWTARVALSVTAWLPCAGTGSVVFAPRPWGPGAKAESVPVAFDDVAGEAVVPGH